MARTEHMSLVVAGAGFAGLPLAIALTQALGEDFTVAVVDPGFGNEPSRDPRASAFVAAARHLLEQIGLWDRIAEHAQPMTTMIITDSRTQDPVRSAFLTFAGEVTPGQPFAHMVENRRVIDALKALATELGVRMIASSVEKAEPFAGHTLVTLANGDVFATPLCVAADGARSRLREAAGIQKVGWEYDQSGIVCTIHHERPHEGTAEEHFLPAGPFAMLPLTGNRTSIVWTEPTSRAQRLIRLPKDMFTDEIETRFGLKLGAFEVVDEPRSFPLGLHIARDFIAPRLALIGDAAHRIHPIAGQGLNMGLKDVAALAEVIAEAARLGLDYGAPHILERYQRWRRLDTVVMAASCDALNRLFSNNVTPLRALRDFGLGLVDRLPGLKAAFIKQAAGLTGEVPRLLKGEAL